MEDARGENGVGLALNDALRKVLERAHAARGDYGDAHRARNGTRERDVEAVLGAVAVHAREKNLSGTAACGLLGPLDGVDARGDAASGKVDLPLVARPHLLGVDGHDHGLAAKGAGSARDEGGVAHGGRVD